MQIEYALGALEAVLFASGEPMEIPRLAEALQMDAGTVRRLADLLTEQYDKRGSGLQLMMLDGALQLTTRSEYAEPIRAALEVKRNTPLSNAALETLTIIAYNQPVTKGFVERVRGVDSSSVVNTLTERGLLEEAGRIEIPGRPVTYRTTAQFLRCFGLQSLADLPPLPNSTEPTMFDIEPDDAAEDETDAAEETLIPPEENLETIEQE
ncbi:MAG: SMC-Scp complex subunit ScpB [Oscillospiraceae bacterium]